MPRLNTSKLTKNILCLPSVSVRFSELIEKNGTYPALSSAKPELGELKEIKGEVEMLIKMLDLIDGDKAEKTGVESKTIEKEDIRHLIMEEVATNLRPKREFVTKNLGRS